ncbi:glycosyltransferase family 2 protein [Paracoccus sediminicola]|uniref:glycosyltransferase family 2 protein n=1 Tax=Paracoccus sediminicola TaxID=3017783 RepID=UPI0022F13D44|nr:glycosyltransferase family A protein [Paracoccus sediminicola]WBU56740.1 glycosyltransferase family A protein [Paracoccus sediminicola]
MSLPRTSLVVVSQGRPEHLRHCLTALSYQNHPDFEIILVADQAGLVQRQDLAIKRLQCDVPNISVARNLGVAAAAGDIIAFIDDDAVAEPNWLARLSAAFARPEIIAATGWTRDRDGFSWQARSHRITPAGQPRNLPPLASPEALPVEDGTPVSTLGTNCAFRADALRRIGGFDPVFSYHLDESDVNLRLAAAFPTALTAIIPDAQVIHLRGGSPTRHDNRAPRDLRQEGRSAALFARRHHGGLLAPDAEARARRRILRHMLDGRIDPLGVRGLLATLSAGHADGMSAPLPDPPDPMRGAGSAFLPVSLPERRHIALGGWHWQAQDLRQRAHAAIQAGNVVSLVLLSPTVIPHRLRLTSSGWFEQLGGVWGRAEPDEPTMRFARFPARLAAELESAENRRNLSLSAFV